MGTSGFFSLTVAVWLALSPSALDEENCLPMSGFKVSLVDSFPLTQLALFEESLVGEAALFKGAAWSPLRSVLVTVSIVNPPGPSFLGEVSWLDDFLSFTRVSVTFGACLEVSCLAPMYGSGLGSGVCERIIEEIM